MTTCRDCRCDLLDLEENEGAAVCDDCAARRRARRAGMRECASCLQLFWPQGALDYDAQHCADCDPSAGHSPMVGDRSHRAQAD